jgi:hypothetical protein
MDKTRHEIQGQPRETEMTTKPSAIDDVRTTARDGKMVKPRRLADALNAAPGTIYGAINRKEIKAVGFGRNRRIPPAEALRLIGDAA